MANDDRTKIIPRRTPESAAMLANVKRAMAITANLNRLTFNDADEIRALFSDLIGKKVDDSFLLIPPFYTTGGVDIWRLWGADLGSRGAERGARGQRPRLQKAPFIDGRPVDLRAESPSQDRPRKRDDTWRRPPPLSRR